MLRTRATNLLIAPALMLALTACGGDDDPSEGNNARLPNSDSPDATTTTPDGGTTTPDDGGTTTPDGGTTTPDDAGEEMSQLQKAQAYTGQVGNTKKGGGGGSFTTDLASAEYAADAGLKAIFDRIVALTADGTLVTDDPMCMRREDGSFPPDDDPCRTPNVREDQVKLEGADQLQVTDAVVTATAFNRTNTNGDWSGASQVWLQDAQSAMIVFLGEDTFKTDGGELIKVGDKVSFKATTLTSFRVQTPQIGAVAEVTRTGQDVTVGVMEKTGQELGIEDWAKMVKVVGEITAVDTPCMGNCYEFTHGGQTITLFSRSTRIEQGDVAAFVGPLGSFPGILQEEPSAQLASDNFDWYFGPFKSNN